MNARTNKGSKPARLGVLLDAANHARDKKGRKAPKENAHSETRPIATPKERATKTNPSDERALENQRVEHPEQYAWITPCTKRNAQFEHRR